MQSASRLDFHLTCTSGKTDDNGDDDDDDDSGDDKGLTFPIMTR